MTALTIEQRDYLMTRLSEITREKIEAKAVELYGPSGRPQQPTWGMVFAAIIAGEITLKPGTENEVRAYLNPSDVEWPAMEAKKAELEAYKATLATERKRLTDQLMLGDGADILAQYSAI
jgi:hypothetical protein